jgi:hypothetical protein
MTREYVKQFQLKDGRVPKKVRFILGYAATGSIGGDEFSVFAPNMTALLATWIKVMAVPLDESKVQRIAITRQEHVQ